MAKKVNKRLARKSRIRKKISGTSERPRLCIFKSLKYTYAQIISDEEGKVIVSASTKNNAAEGKSASCKESAKALGVKIAELAKSKNVSKVVFDRSGYIFHGRVSSLAEGAREGGLEF